MIGLLTREGYTAFTPCNAAGDTRGPVTSREDGGVDVTARRSHFLSDWEDPL